MIDRLSPAEWGASLKPPITARRARVLCEEGRVKGATRHGGKFRAIWEIPKDAPDPRKSPGRPIEG